MAKSRCRPHWSGDRVRDEYEIALVKAFVRAGKPVFGVCRGLQLINVAFGGTLYQDIATQQPGALVHRDGQIYDQLPPVDIVPGTRLAQLCRPARRTPSTACTTRASRTWRPASWWRRAAPTTA
jgi:putative glutamine amidotransferase